MRTIQLTDLVVRQMTLDYVGNCVNVFYDFTDSSGRVWDSGVAVFYAVMPPQVPIYNENNQIVGYEPYPDTWFQLPESYFPLLIGLKNDADAALSATFLV